jgi:hypothetical protein
MTRLMGRWGALPEAEKVGCGLSERFTFSSMGRPSLPGAAAVVEACRWEGWETSGHGCYGNWTARSASEGVGWDGTGWEWECERGWGGSGMGWRPTGHQAVGWVAWSYQSDQCFHGTVH